MADNTLGDTDIDGSDEMEGNDDGFGVGQVLHVIRQTSLAGFMP